MAEGTIFGVFEGKDELIEAALDAAFDLAPFEAALDALPTDLDLSGRLVAYVELLQQRLISIFVLMRSVGMIAPREAGRYLSPARKRIDAKAAAYIAPSDEVSVSTEQLLHLIRLLTFSGSHYEIAHGVLLSPEEIVSTVLDGVRKAESDAN